MDKELKRENSMFGRGLKDFDLEIYIGFKYWVLKFKESQFNLEV